ncbi:hypothetical protein MMC10_001140 [Thelotrema lepadinum]|nr:hypothetical protein [Thelotrema lepadinum]
MALPNVWHLRTVADSASRSCYVCYKPTTGVLITPDNKDFFYVCRGHLEDRGFCSPIIDEAAAADKKKEALDQEIEAIKKEYEEKKKKKGDKAKEKSKEQDKDGSKNQKQGGPDEEKEAEKEKDEKIKAATEKQKDVAKDMPRIYSLHRNFYQMRLDKLRHAEIARRNRERLSNPSAFPAVPSGNP